MARGKPVVQHDVGHASENGNRHVDNASLAELVQPGHDQPSILETAAIEPPTAEVEEHHVFVESDQAGTSGTLSREELFLDDDEDLDSEPRFLTSVSCHQPEDTYAFRVRTGKDWRGTVLILNYRDENKKYPLPKGRYLILRREVQRAFKKRGRRCLLLTCTTGEGRMFLWDIKITEGFGDSWYQGDLEIAKRAEDLWVRWDGTDGNAHAAVPSRQDWGEPQWRGESFLALIELAFKGKIVDNFEHPLCKIFEISQ